MGAVQSAVGEDAVLYGPGRWTLGFHKGGGTPEGVEPPVRVIARARRPSATPASAAPSASPTPAATCRSPT